MAVTWFHPVLLSLAAMLWSATLSPSNPPALKAPPDHVSLAGELLVASPGIVDPRFRHAVILIAKEDAGGALGIVINRPIGTIPLASLLHAMGLNATGVKGDVRTFSGGPVEPDLGFVLHGADYHRAGTIAIDGRVAMTLNPDVLLDIGHGRGPAKYLIAFGYAGWGPGQLAAELARGDWLITGENAKLVFDEDRARVWHDAMADAMTQGAAPP
jgi:putative transcriptional regulator